MSEGACFDVLKSNLEQLLQIQSKKDVFDVIGTGLRQCTQDSIVIVNEVVKNETLTITRGIYGLPYAKLNKYFKLLGIDPIGQTYKLKPFLLDAYRKGGLHTIDQGLAAFSDDTFGATTLNAISKMLDLQQIYTIGLKKKHKVIAAIHIFKRHKKSLPEKDIIVQMIGQAEIALQNRLYQIELEKELSSKQQFLSILAHDLKSPFTSILGLLELIKRGFSKYSKEKLKRLFMEVLNEAENTYTLLDNLLTWSNAEQHNLRFSEEQIDLHALANEVVNQHKLPARKKAVDFVHSIEQNTFVIADYQMLHTIMRNLVSNAIKFTPTHGHIEIKATLESKSHLRISVIDTGSGMEQEIIEKILNSAINFTTRGTNNEKGTGLGLMIAKEFIHQHGTELIINSTPGNGSTFSFILPIATS